MIDQNRDGYIDKEDLLEMMTSLGKDPSNEYLEKMITEAPGPINFTMFLTLLARSSTVPTPRTSFKTRLPALTSMTQV